jgi:hypothetical protein
MAQTTDNQHLPPGQSTLSEGVVHVAREWQERAHNAAVRAAIATTMHNAGLAAILADPEPLPGILLQAVIIPGDKTTEGQLIDAVASPWFKILQLIKQRPETIHEIDWRKWEEIIAGAYSEEGFQVILTPRSNDKGRDIVATKNEIGSIRIIDQVKAYKPGHVVTAEEVRAMLGVLTLEPMSPRASLRPPQRLPLVCSRTRT